jgi:photosystem II stability/assembly factor-like uncharacterized protein
VFDGKNNFLKSKIYLKKNYFLGILIIFGKNIKITFMKKLLLLLAFVPFTQINAQTWTPQATGFADVSRGLIEIRIVDANTVWAMAYDGVTTTNNIQELTSTTDGGNTWSPVVMDIGDPALELNNLIPVDGTTAWVSALIPADGNGVIFKTTDGGASWEQQNSGAYITSGESFLNSVYFFNANDGVSYGDPTGGEYEIYTTSDGGANWTAVPAANKPNPLSGEYGYNSRPTAVGNTIWFTTNKGRLFRSSDKGLTWAAAQAPLTDFGAAAQSGSIYFSTENNGLLLKSVGSTTPVYTYYTTTNGGTSWSAASPFTGTRRLLAYVPGTSTILATSAATGFVGTSISYNNGAAWTEIEAASQRGIPAVLNATTAWCAGFNSSPSSGGIFKLEGSLATASFEATSFTVYPNPANNNVTISTSVVDSYKLNVTDLTGKVVLEKSLSGIENTIDISSLSSGAYLFTLNSDNKSETVKIIKN